MTSGRSGPCVIALPMDVQANSVECNLMPVKAEKADSLPCADMEYIEKAICLMRTAKRPVILAGGGALRAKAADLITALAEKWGAAIVTTLAGKGAVSEEHEQYCFHTGSKGTPIGLKICREADVVLALGTRFADETTCSYRKGIAFNFPDTKLIHIDIDASEIGKNYGADVGIVADLKDSLKKLIDNYTDKTVRKEYFEEIKTLRAQWEQYKEDYRSIKSEKMTISQLIGLMNKKLPSNTIITTSSGNTQAQLFQEYCFKEPYCNLTTGGFSTMGWAVPAAMGAKLAKPEVPVIALLGDGDFMMIIQELSTMAQYDIPVIIVLANNCGWMAIKDLQMDVLGKETAFGNDFMQGDDVYSPDFCSIAKAFNIEAYKADTKDEIETALCSAIKANKPALISVDVSREYPYTGGKAFGWWDVPIPTYMQEKRAVYENAVKEETV